MPRVPCEVVREPVTEGGATRPGVRVVCGECEHSVQSFGQEDKSVRRCFVLLKESCPEGRTDNFYVDDSDD